MASEAYIILSIIRFLVPLSILKWPLLGILVIIYIDVKDFNFLNIQTPAQAQAYQVWDKIFDIYYLSIAAFVSFRWKEKLARKISVFSFLYRLFGVLIFSLIGARGLLIFFPNFFENFFLFYMIFTKFSKGKKLLTSRIDALIVLTALLIPSVTREYFMHVIKTSPWDIYDIAKFLGIEKPWFNVSYWSWIAIFLSLPVAALVWKLAKNSR